MPVYDYECKGCGHEFQREQRITANPVKKCPECGAMKAKRLISQTSFVLKGSGWYNDLYASNQPAKNDEGSGKETSESKDTGKSESKDEPKGGGKSESKGKGKGQGGSKKGKSAA